VRLRETSPGVLRMDHDSGRHDDRAIALALACHRLVARGEESAPMRVFVARGRIDEAPLARRDAMPDVEQRSLAKLYGRALGSETSFARRRLRRIPGAGRPNALDRRLGEEFGLARWSVERGQSELAEILDRARRE
jgi:hypothetical protein